MHDFFDIECSSATCFENAAVLVSVAAAAAGSAPLAAAAAITAAYLGLYPALLLVSHSWLSIPILFAISTFALSLPYCVEHPIALKRL